MARLPVSKAIDLVQLQAEMNAAGVNVTALGQDAAGLFTYNAQGQDVDLPGGAAAVLAAHTPSTALRDQLSTLLQSTVGVAIADLTQAQRLALIAGLLHKAGAINPQTLQIKPLNTWLI